MGANYQFGCLMEGSELIRKGLYSYELENSKRPEQQYIGFWNEFDMNYWLDHRGALNSLKDKIYVMPVGKYKGIYMKCPRELATSFNPMLDTAVQGERFRQMAAAKAWYEQVSQQQEMITMDEQAVNEQADNADEPEEKMDFYTKNIRHDVIPPSVRYPDKTIHIYVDASFSQETSLGGYGIIFYQDEDYNQTFRSDSYALRVPKEIGIDSLEKLAILQALAFIPYPSNIIVHTDQKAVVDYVENGALSDLVVQGLFDENFREISLNQRSFWRMIAKWKLLHDRLIFNYTPSHQGDEMHEICDALARQACRHYHEDESWTEGNLPQSFAAGYDYRRHYNKLDEASMLAHRARLEEMELGKVEVVCPKCHQHPKVIHDGNRIIVGCPCGYVVDGEIMF